MSGGGSFPPTGTEDLDLDKTENWERDYSSISHVRKHR